MVTSHANNKGFFNGKKREHRKLICNPPLKKRKADVLGGNSDGKINIGPEMMIQDKEEQIQKHNELKEEELKNQYDYIVKEMESMTTLMQQHETANENHTQENDRLCDKIVELVSLEKNTRFTLELKLQKMKKVNQERISKLDDTKKNLIEQLET